MFVVSALSNMGAWNQTSCDPKTLSSRKRCVLVHCLAGKCKSLAILQVCKNGRFERFCVCNDKNSTVCHLWTRWSLPSKQDSYWTTDSTGCDKQVLTQGTLWRHHFVITSKEYLTNGRILLNYFELVFFRLQLVKNSCKLIIIWVNYERKKKGAFYETLCSMYSEFFITLGWAVGKQQN